MTETAAFKLHILDHIPQKAFERIALALMENNADKHTLNLYKVIVHFKAAVILCRREMQVVQSPEVQAYIKKAKNQHTHAAIAALDGVSFLVPPSLLLLQALLTGVS